MNQAAQAAQVAIDKEKGATEAPKSGTRSFVGAAKCKYVCEHSFFNA